MQGFYCQTMTSCTFWGKALDLRFCRMVSNWRYIWRKQFISTRQGESFPIFPFQADVQHFKIKQKNMLLPRNLVNHLAHYSNNHCGPLLKKSSTTLFTKSRHEDNFIKPRLLKANSVSSHNYWLPFVSPLLTEWIFTCSAIESRC